MRAGEDRNVNGYESDIVCGEGFGGRDGSFGSAFIGHARCGYYFVLRCLLLVTGLTPPSSLVIDVGSVDQFAPGLHDVPVLGFRL